MAINEHNYEAYFIDYHEGNLSRKEEAALMAFLESNPDLKCELDDFEMISFEADDSITYNNKGAIKTKALSNLPTETDEMLIAYLEGDLLGDEKAEIETILSEDKKAEAAFATFEKSKLKADLQITHPDKSALKKRAGILALPTWTGYAAAAVIIILLGLTFYFRFSTSAPQIQQQVELAQLESISVMQIDFANDKQISQRRGPSNEKVQTTYREEYTAFRLISKSITNISYPVNNSAELALIDPRILPTNPSYQTILNQELLASLDEPRQKEKGLVSKVFSGLFGKIVPNSGSRKKTDVTTESRPMSLWDIADLGMRGVNVLGDHDYTLIKEYNENGNVKGVSILEE